MQFSFSEFGQRVGQGSGIEQLMDDLGYAIAEGGSGMHMLGGGNPAAIPEVTAIWRDTMQGLLSESPDRFDRMLVNYDPCRGNVEFVNAVANFFNRQYGWGITSDNVVVTNGGQTAFYYLINLLAGQHRDGNHRKIVLPLVPEYIGYANQGIGDDYFRAIKPKIDILTPTTFKYRVDFDAIQLDDNDAAVCVSRPTNPTGNVLTDNEIQQLAAMSLEKGIPLIVDNAYGAPFPNIVFGDVTPLWAPNMVLTFSLSKLGLPGTRTGIVIGPPEITASISSLNAVAGLANGNVGQVLVKEILNNDQIVRISNDVVRPFYQRKSQEAQKMVAELLPNDRVKVHVSEGALFLWLWLDISISSQELYERLKARGVLIVPGEYFFFGLSEPWNHQTECVRMSFAMPNETVWAGIEILADELKSVSRR